VRKRGKPPNRSGSPGRTVAPSEALGIPTPSVAGPRTFSLRAKLSMAAVAAVAVFAGGLAFQFLGGNFRKVSPAGVPGAGATFVGSETCAGCHQVEARLWQGSQHQLAMAHATDKSVLGDFSDATFDYFGMKSRFFRKNGKYLVETDGSNGELATFEIKYTFGVDPLQQYLVAFPDGRLQSLSIAWTAGQKTKADNAGSISIQRRKSATTMCCIGQN
jgi:hypothetical protein